MFCLVLFCFALFCFLFVLFLFFFLGGGEYLRGRVGSVKVGQPPFAGTGLTARTHLGTIVKYKSRAFDL